MPCVRPDGITALYDAVLNVSIVSKVYIIQNNGILYYTVITDKDFFKDYGIFNRSVNNASTAYQTVLYDRARIIFRRRLVAHL